jgi:hypothetical protein
MITCVQRCRLAWLVAISLMTVGSLAAHSVAYRFVETDADPSAEALAATGHGYLGYAPFLVASALAIGAAVLVSVVVRAARGSLPAPRSVWQLALLPPLAFVLQEYLERLAAGGEIGDLLAQPTFLVGLALQVPFAAAALLAARTLTRAAVSLGAALAPTRPALLCLRSCPAVPGDQIVLPARPFATADRAVRGPPARPRH